MLYAELHKRYSVEGLLTELEKIKVMILPDGQRITTNIQRDSAKSLGPSICVPKMEGGQVESHHKKRSLNEALPKSSF